MATEAIGKRLWEVYPDLEKSGFGPVYRKALLERTPQYQEGFYQDGREKYAGWFAVSVYPRGTGVLAMIRNVSQRRRAELAWREADAKLTALLGATGRHRHAQGPQPSLHIGQSRRDEDDGSECWRLSHRQDRP